MKQITITDKCYVKWIKDLANRYRQSQIKAAVKVNSEKLVFNWRLGRDIVEMDVDQQLVGIFQIPWGHHCLIMDKVKEDLDKSLFYVSKTIENGWSRSMLLKKVEGLIPTIEEIENKLNEK